MFDLSPLLLDLFNETIIVAYEIQRNFLTFQAKFVEFPGEK